MIRNIDDILELYARRGGLRYGEGVTQTEHAIQCAALARARGAAPPLVVAALLHDIGHLLDEASDHSVDRGHELIGAAVLAPLFGAAVAEPVALHVAAKRYLCARDPAYFGALSRASQRSLAVQGGAFDCAAAVAFEQRPYAEAAVTLRRFDDSGKRGDVSRAINFADYASLLRAQAIAVRTA